MKLIAALDSAGIELIGEGAASTSGGRGVRLKPGVVFERFRQHSGRGRRIRLTNSVSVVLFVVVASRVVLVSFARCSSLPRLPLSRPGAIATRLVYGLTFVLSSLAVVILLFHLPAIARNLAGTPAARPALARRLPPRRAVRRLLSCSSSISAAPRASLYGLGYGRHEEAPPERVLLPFLSRLPRRHEPRAVAGRRRLHLPARLGVHVAGVLGAGHGAPPRAGQRRAPATSISSWRASARSRCCSPSACSPGPTAATPSTPSAPPPARRWLAGAGPGPGRCSAPARRRASCRCMSGCRSPIRPRRATSRR